MPLENLPTLGKNFEKEPKFFIYSFHTFWRASIKSYQVSYIQKVMEEKKNMQAPTK